MALLIFAIIVLIVAGLLVYAVDLIPLTAPFNNLLKLLVILVAVVVIASRVM